jgi:hypothetical protein
MLCHGGVGICGLAFVLRNESKASRSARGDMGKKVSRRHGHGPIRNATVVRDLPLGAMLAMAWRILGPLGPRS